MSAFFFNDTAATEIYTLSLHDALPIWLAVADHDVSPGHGRRERPGAGDDAVRDHPVLHGPQLVDPLDADRRRGDPVDPRSEEHTSELQSRQYLVCRLLLEEKRPIVIFT